MGIVRFALRFPHTFYVLAALILFLGIAAIRSMPTDIFPEIRIPVVTVIWQYTGLTTPEMEQRVSTYSQYSISANVNGIKNMEAQTFNGLSIQKIYFQPDVNLDLAIAQIVSQTAARCYGVVGIGGGARAKVGRLLPRSRGVHGISVTADGDSVSLDLHVVVEHGLNLAEVASSVSNRVAYEVERLTGLPVRAVEVHVDDVRTGGK